MASGVPNESSQTVPHVPLILISNLPSYLEEPPTNRTLTGSEINYQLFEFPATPPVPVRPPPQKAGKIEDTWRSLQLANPVKISECNNAFQCLHVNSPETQMTPMSSPWLQFSWPIGLAVQSIILASSPLQTTSSRKVGPEPRPKYERGLATAPALWKENGSYKYGIKTTP